MDIIPVSRGPFYCANAQEFPAMWHRMQARRQFMIQKSGLRLHRLTDLLTQEGHLFNRANSSGPANRTCGPGGYAFGDY
jgi:hypothetical protein